MILKIYKIVSDDFSSVSSGSSRASYLSDSLRLSALTEERSVEDSFNYHHVDRVVDELIQTEFTYLESLNELIHVRTKYLGISRINTVKIRRLNWGLKISEVRENTRHLLGFVSYFFRFRSFWRFFGVPKLRGFWSNIGSKSTVLYSKMDVFSKNLFFERNPHNQSSLSKSVYFDELNLEVFFTV